MASSELARILNRRGGGMMPTLDPCLEWAKQVGDKLGVEFEELKEVIDLYHQQGQTCDEVQSFLSRQATVRSLSEKLKARSL